MRAAERFAGLIVAVGLAIAALAGIARAEDQKTPQAVAAPATDEATGLTFPSQIGGVAQLKSMDYGRSHNRPDLGYSWSYAAPGRLSATVYVYDLGKPTVPFGATSSEVAGQFQQSLDDIYRAAKLNRYDDLQPFQGPDNCKIGPLTFRCATLSAVTAKGNNHVFTAAMVTGYRNHYLKIRIDWAQGSAESQSAKDQFLQALGAIIPPGG